MVTRSISADGREHDTHTNPRSSKTPPRKASVTWAKLPTHKNTQHSIPRHSEPIQEHASEVRGPRSSNPGTESGVDDGFLRSSAGRSGNLPRSNIKFERRRSFGNNSDRNQEESRGSQHNRRRLSFAVGRDADQGPVAETWQIFVDDRERQEAAQILERDQTLHDPDQYELQTIVAALIDKNTALRNEVANMKADDKEARQQKALKHRRFLSAKMPGLIDRYDFDSEEEVDLEEAMQKEYEITRPRETKRVSPSGVEGQLNRQPTHSPGPQMDDEVSASATPSGVRRDSHTSTRRQQLEQSNIRARTQTHDEASSASSDIIAGGFLPGEVERTLELQKQLDDLTKRHNASRQENMELKKERRAIQAERDKFKLENFNLQRTRSDEQYEKLRKQYGELQEQTQELLRQRQELLDMSNQMASKLPEFRAVQTDNLRKQQMFWERERARGNAPPLGQIAEEGSSTSTDTLTALTRNRPGPVQHATPLQHSRGIMETRNPDETQLGSASTDEVEPAAIETFSLKSRQGSTAPAAPGKGLEESRRNGPSPLKQRPGSIVHPTKQVRGLPKQAERGPLSYHRVRDLARSDVIRSPTKPSSQTPDVDSIKSADYSGGSSAVHTADQIDVLHMVSQTPPNTPGNLVLHDTSSQEHDHLDHPHAGMTPYFELVKQLPAAINTRAVIKCDVKASDDKYKFHEFKKGDQVFVYVDGMHQFWPAKLSEEPEAEVYILPRNLIALVCDHGYEYKEMYVVTRSWYERYTPGMKSEYLSVDCGKHLHCAHSFETAPARKGEVVRTWRCMKSQDGTRKGLVPAEVLKKMNAFAAPLLTASLCPCAEPQPYTGRARVLADCHDLSGKLSLKDGAEIEVSHLDTNLKAYCVQDPKSKIQGLVDASALRLIRNATEGDSYEQYVLDLTPKYFDFMTSELKAIEVTEAEVKAALRGPRPSGSMSEEAKRRWEQNLDGMNPNYKNFDEEMLKCKPVTATHWLRWSQEGLPPVVGYSIIKNDLDTIKKGKRFKGSILKEINWKTFLDTYPMVPLGPGTGVNRARSRSVPALRNPIYLSEKEQEEETLMDKPPHIGHQPHRKIADGVCPDRDYMSEPANGEPHDMKRRYIYIRPNGDWLACEAETEFDVHDLDLWRNNRKSGKNWLAARKQGFLQFQPVEEDVIPFSFDDAVQDSANFHTCAKERLERADFDVIDLLHTHKKHGLSLVYGLKHDPNSIPVMALDGLTVDERFEIIDMPGPEMRSVNFEPQLRVRAVTKAGAGTTLNDISSYDASQDMTYLISPLDLDPVPYLRTAVFKDEPMPDYLMPRERDNYRFVLLRESNQDFVWDALQGGKIIATKLDMIELEDTKLWKPLNSILGQIQLAYQQKEVMDALEKDMHAESEADSTESVPQIEDWNFWYPVVQGLTGFGNGFVDVDDPDINTGEPADYVRIMPGSEHPDTYMCIARNNKQTGLIHTSAIDLSKPYLQSFTPLEAGGSPGNDDFLLLKEDNAKIFISSEDNGMGWMDANDLMFDEDESRMVSLLELFDRRVFNIDDFEGASTFLEHLRFVGEQQNQTNVRNRPRSGRTFRTDSSGPPISLYCPRSARERERENIVSATPNSDAPTSPRDLGGSGSSGDVFESVRRSLPRDVGITGNESGDKRQQPEGSRFKATNNSTMGIIDPPALGPDRNSTAPEVPVETKPTQNGSRNSSSATNAGDAGGAVEPDAQGAQATSAAPDSDGMELMIRYDEWVKREEVYADYVNQLGSLLTTHGRLLETIPRPVMAKVTTVGYVKIPK